MIRTVTSFFKRVFTEDKFPKKKESRMDKKVEDVYNVDVKDSKMDDKKVVVLDPREEMESEVEVE